MQTAVRFALFALIGPAAAAQTPDVAEILAKVSETYKTASQYEFVGDTTSSKGVNANPSHLLIAFKAPDRYRMEGAFPGGGTSRSDFDFSEVVMVHDGSALWFYMPKSNMYGSFPANALTPNAPGDLGDLRPEAMDYFVMWKYRGAKDFVGGSKFLWQEVIEVAGAKAECYVLAVSTAPTGPVYTWWIDKNLFRILREEYEGLSSVFTSIKLNEPLPAELFKFEPPAGAKKMEPQH
jgi:outer membrane lipoprotein-sorting protein